MSLKTTQALFDFIRGRGVRGAAINHALEIICECCSSFDSLVRSLALTQESSISDQQILYSTEKDSYLVNNITDTDDLSCSPETQVPFLDID
jgi:hypothetical protein